MDFWNDNTTFVTQKKWRMWTQEKCQSSVKIKIKNIVSSNEKFIIKVHWNFPNIYILFLKVLMMWLLYVYFWKWFNLLHGFFDQSHV
jgi:hypothetical protein